MRYELTVSVAIYVYSIQFNSSCPTLSDQQQFCAQVPGCKNSLAHVVVKAPNPVISHLYLNLSTGSKLMNELITKAKVQCRQFYLYCRTTHDVLNKQDAA